MNRPWGVILWPGVVMLALVLALPAVADPLAPPWTGRDVGAPGAAGSTEVDSNDVWTVRGSGTDIWSTADHFYYAYQPLKGDASITARFLSQEGGDAEWARVGLMIRENDARGSPNLSPSSPNLNYAIAKAHGLVVSVRFQQDAGTLITDEVGPSIQVERNLTLRLQRAGNEISGFYSRDGRLWFQAFFPPQILPTLTDQALFGLSATSHQDGKLTATRVDHVRVEQGAVMLMGVTACGGDRRVLLQWRPLPGALGYNVYRGGRDATGDQMTRLNGDRVAEASFTDTSADLVNGIPLTYGVAPLFPGAGGSLVEGPVVAVQATPVEGPPGYLGCSINERRPSGSVRYDPATGRITLRSSGGGIGAYWDEFYFLGQPASGDVQITVRMYSPPTGMPGKADLTATTRQAGLIIRDSLESGARNVFFGVTGKGLLRFSHRDTTNGPTMVPVTLFTARFRPPLRLRLIRRGNTVQIQYSMDDGKSFQPAAGGPITWASPLGPMLYVGVADTPTDRSQVSEAQFADLKVEKP